MAGSVAASTDGVYLVNNLISLGHLAIQADRQPDVRTGLSRGPCAGHACFDAGSQDRATYPLGRCGHRGNRRAAGTLGVLTEQCPTSDTTAFKNGKEKHHVKLGHHLPDHRHCRCRTGLRWYRRRRYRYREDSLHCLPGTVRRFLLLRSSR
uniref:Secreted protein n=1 Tax=Steinernema glaseri TaxID=37863 RepID=A0A1I8AMQ9_9BILA